MNKVSTSDNVECTWTYARFIPSGPQNGMAPAMSYLWLQVPNGTWYQLKRFRSSSELRRIVMGNTLTKLMEFLENESQ